MKSKKNISKKGKKTVHKNSKVKRYKLKTPSLVRAVNRSNQVVGIVSLILNILFFPGLGSLIVGRKEGPYQMISFVLALIISGKFYVDDYLAWASVFMLVTIGIWLWSVISGIKILQNRD